MIQLTLEYLVVTFVLGAVWHVVLFVDYYKKLEIYSGIDNPKFIFGFSSMVLQGIVLAYLYPLINNVTIFSVGLFMTLVSFAVFAEVGKQKTTSVLGFLKIQIAFCAVQTLLVTAAFYLIPLI